MWGLFDAWGNWSAGQSVTDEELWGLSILWWGRVGMGMEFLAALTIIAEIIGPNRLRILERTLRAHDFTRKALRFSLKTLWWAWLQLVMYVFSSEDSPRQRRATDQAWAMGAAKVHVILSALLILPIGYALYHPEAWWEWLIALWTAFFLALFVAIPLTVIVVVVPALLATAFDWAVVEPVARLLESRRVSTWIRIGSAVLLFAGFHFDLLAS